MSKLPASPKGRKRFSAIETNVHTGAHQEGGFSKVAGSSKDEGQKGSKEQEGSKVPWFQKRASLSPTPYSKESSEDTGTWKRDAKKKWTDPSLVRNASTSSLELASPLSPSSPSSPFPPSPVEPSSTSHKENNSSLQRDTSIRSWYKKYKDNPHTLLNSPYSKSASDIYGETLQEEQITSPTSPKSKDFNTNLTRHVSQMTHSSSTSSAASKATSTSSLQGKSYLSKSFATLKRTASARAVLMQRQGKWFQVVYPQDYDYGPLLKLDPSFALTDKIRHLYLVDTTELSPQEIKRQEVIFELICTEESYVNDLQLIIKLFLRKFEKKEWMDHRSRALIFSNIEQLLPINKVLLSSLKESRFLNKGVINNIGGIVLNLIEFLKMYTGYCGSHSEGIQHLASLQKSNKDLQLYLKYCMLKPECRGLDLASYLLKPVQRICKYPMLLKEILKYTPDAHPDYKDMNKALDAISRVVNTVNERRRFMEETQKLIQTLSLLDFEEPLPQNHLRRFVAETYVTKLKGDFPLLSEAIGFPNHFINLNAYSQIAVSTPHNLKTSERWLIILSDYIILAKRSLLTRHKSGRSQVRALLPIPPEGITMWSEDKDIWLTNVPILIVRDVPDDSRYKNKVDFILMSPAPGDNTRVNTKEFHCCCANSAQKKQLLEDLGTLSSTQSDEKDVVSQICDSLNKDRDSIKEPESPSIAVTDSPFVDELGIQEQQGEKNKFPMGDPEKLGGRGLINFAIPNSSSSSIVMQDLQYSSPRSSNCEVTSFENETTSLRKEVTSDNTKFSLKQDPYKAMSTGKKVSEAFEEPVGMAVAPGMKKNTRLANPSLASSIKRPSEETISTTSQSSAYSSFNSGFNTIGNRPLSTQFVLLGGVKIPNAGASGLPDQNSSSAAAGSNLPGNQKPLMIQTATSSAQNKNSAKSLHVPFSGVSFVSASQPNYSSPISTNTAVDSSNSFSRSWDNNHLSPMATSPNYINTSPLTTINSALPFESTEEECNIQEENNAQPNPPQTMAVEGSKGEEESSLFSPESLHHIFSTLHFQEYSEKADKLAESKPADNQAPPDKVKDMEQKPLPEGEGHEAPLNSEDATEAELDWHLTKMQLELLSPTLHSKVPFPSLAPVSMGLSFAEDLSKTFGPLSSHPQTAKTESRPAAITTMDKGEEEQDEDEKETLFPLVEGSEVESGIKMLKTLVPKASSPHHHRKSLVSPLSIETELRSREASLLTGTPSGFSSAVSLSATASLYPYPSNEDTHDVAVSSEGGGVPSVRFAFPSPSPLTPLTPADLTWVTSMASPWVASPSSTPSAVVAFMEERPRKETTWMAPLEDQESRSRSKSLSLLEEPTTLVHLGSHYKLASSPRHVGHGAAFRPGFLAAIPDDGTVLQYEDTLPNYISSPVHRRCHSEQPRSLSLHSPMP